MSKNKGEPTLEKIDDYNGNESKQKRNIIRLVIVLLLVFGAVLTYLNQPTQNELKKVEARIEELETRDKEIDETMILPDICTNVAECAKLSKEKAAITEELEGLYEKWEELA